MSVKVSIEGLEEFRKLFSSNPSLETLIPDLSLSILKVHNKLEERLKTVYTTPGSLSSVRVNGREKPIHSGKNFLTYGLAYRDKAILLSKYKYSVGSTEESKPSKAPLREKGSLDWVHWKLGKWGRPVTVEIRRGKKVLARRKKGSRIKAWENKGQLYARRQMKTWKEIPKLGEPGVRGDFSLLFGPSLATLAISLSNHDKEVQKTIDSVADDLISAMKKNWYN